MQRKLYSPQEHKIDPSQIDLDVLWILQRLREEGFVAYLVGGSVRDLLLGRTPKDFDISTSARPDQIKAIFRRQCLLIGRRFRLAHIRFGHKVIEVATFRRGESDSGLIKEDNEWGTEEEDVLRRDFTMNGLFYDSATETIIDYVGGWEDIQNSFIRVIGDPITRFKQDPVRLIRLLKFRARYGFHTDTSTLEALHSCRYEILKSSSARVIEELIRMLESGASNPFFRLLAEEGLLDTLIPPLMKRLMTQEGKLIFHYLTCVDRLYQHHGKNTLDRGILLSCLIYPILEKVIDCNYLSKGHIPHIGEITLITSSLIQELFIQPLPHFPRKLVSQMITTLVAQYRLTPLSKKKQSRDRLLKHKDFEFAIRFFKIRAMVDARWFNLYTSLKTQHRQLMRQGLKKHHQPPSHAN